MLYQCISGAFCVLVLLSNIISAKMVALPFVDFTIPAGLLTYPLTFLLSDLVTELFGAKKAREMVYLSLGMNLLSLGILQLALLVPASNPLHEEAFSLVLGMSGMRIFASLTAYLASQLVDIQLYAWIKRRTRGRWLWLRNNGSTFISQAVDTILIDLIYLCIGLKMGLVAILPIMLFSFIYKAFFSVATTPLLYALLYLIKPKARAGILN